MLTPSAVREAAAQLVEREKAYLRECGCEERRLGYVPMPEGYSLWLDADSVYYFWLRHADGATSVIHHDRWAIYRGAKRDAALRGTRVPQE